MTAGLRYCVRISYPPGLGQPAMLSHRGRTEWARRNAQRHAADVRGGRTGLRGFLAVDVIRADLPEHLQPVGGGRG
jgi:hypothetical protein